jgi:hypothetical protein
MGTKQASKPYLLNARSDKKKENSWNFTSVSMFLLLPNKLKNQDQPGAPFSVA